MNLNITKTKVYILTLLSFVGLVVSFYLLVKYVDQTAILCTGEVNTCEIVRASKYAYVLGIYPLPLFGVAFFLYLIVMLLVSQIKPALAVTKAYTLLLGIPVLLALVVETYLSYIQVFILQALCIWCLSIEVIVFLISLTTFYKSSWRTTYLPHST